MKKNKQFFKSGIHVLEIHIEASAWVCIFLVADQLVSKQTTDNNWTNTLLSNLNAPRKSTDLVEKRHEKTPLCNVQNTKTLLIVFFSFFLSLFFLRVWHRSTHFFSTSYTIYSVLFESFSRAHTFSDRFFLRNRTLTYIAAKNRKR